MKECCSGTLRPEVQFKAAAARQQSSYEEILKSSQKAYWKISSSQFLPQPSPKTCSSIWHQIVIQSYEWFECAYRREQYTKHGKDDGVKVNRATPIILEGP